MVLKISSGFLHTRQSVKSSHPALAIASFTKNKHLASPELRRAELLLMKHLQSHPISIKVVQKPISNLFQKLWS